MDTICQIFYAVKNTKTNEVVSLSTAALVVVRAVVVHVCVHEKCNSEIKCIVMLKGHFHGKIMSS